MTPADKTRVAELLNTIHNAADEIEELLGNEKELWNMQTAAGGIHHFVTKNIGRDPELFITPKMMAERLLAE